MINVIKQIEYIKEPYIMIVDNNFIYNQKRLAEFCDLIESRQIHKKFFCYGSAESIVNHRETLPRLVKNGLKAVIVGFESFDAKDLKSYHKKATLAQNLQAAAILKDLKIDCWASFILHPDWDKKDFQKLRQYIKGIKPEFASLNPMTPFPGGPLYHKYKDRVLFKKEDYDHWSFSIISVQPSQMSLRHYYYQVLKTNLYVNMFINRPYKMLRKYGCGNLLRILKGSLGFVNLYIRLMFKGQDISS